MIELLILYILSNRETTMYSTLKRIKDEFGAYTKPSFGAIHPALVRLEAAKLISSRKNISKGGKVSVYYSISQLGKEKLKKLLLEKISDNPLQFPPIAKIKLSCAGYLPETDRKNLFFEIKSKAQSHKFNAEKILENNGHNLSFYQRIMLDDTVHEYSNFISLIESLEKENASNCK